MNQSFEFDPKQILQVSPAASLEEIREAYRSKTKKHHPDLGGDEWAFRLVTQAYEALGQARVAAYFHEPPSGPAVDEPIRRPPSPPAEASTVRRGLRDQVTSPKLLVDIESLILRHELDNPYEVLTTSESERNLSCSLSVVWPSSIAETEVDPADREALLDQITKAFTTSATKAKPLAARQQTDEGRFRGLVSLPSARATSDAFLILRDELRRRGLGTNQWTREIVIPRDRNDSD